MHSPSALVMKINLHCFGLLQVFINSIWFGLGLEEATTQSRLHHQLFPPELALESDFDQVTHDAQ